MYEQIFGNKLQYIEIAKERDKKCHSIKLR